MALRVAVTLALLATLSLGFAWALRGWAAYRRERAEFIDAPEAGQDRPPPGPFANLVRNVTWSLSDTSTQQAWFLPSRNGALVIFVHGSPGSRASLWSQAADLAKDGYGLLLLDLPGYGRSEGHRLWDQTFEESLIKAVDFAAGDPSVDPQRIAGFGFSLGSCSLARAAVDEPRLGALILLAPFTNLREQLLYQFRSRWPGVAHLAVLAARQAGVPVDELDTARAVAQLGNRPILLIGGRRDPVIPSSMVERLGTRASNVSVLLVDDMGHGWMEGNAPFPAERIRTFLRDALQSGTELGAFSVP